MRKRWVRRLLLGVGCALILCAAALTVIWQISMKNAAMRSQEHAALLKQLLPQDRTAVPEVRADNEMPALSLDGVDYVGLVEIPSQDACLPVRSDWARDLPAPCVFSGSLYDGSLVIGAGSQSGQMPFYAQLDSGDVLFFTDMTGCCYAYRINFIEYRDHADAQAFSEHESEITLFIKNQQAVREYIILYCTTLGS